MPEIKGQATGRHAKQVEMMVARLLCGRARAVGYILLRDNASERGASFIFDTSIDFRRDTCEANSMSSSFEQANKQRDSRRHVSTKRSIDWKLADSVFERLRS
jgi:hypothetical protein